MVNKDETSVPAIRDWGGSRFVHNSLKKQVTSRLPSHSGTPFLGSPAQATDDHMDVYGVLITPLLRLLWGAIRDATSSSLHLVYERGLSCAVAEL